MPESSPFGPEQPDEKSDTLPKKRRSGNALSRYLLQRRSQERAETSHDLIDTTDAESESKPKRLKSLFNKIFPRIVEKADIVDSSKPRQFDPELFFSWHGADEQPEPNHGPGSAEAEPESVGQQIETPTPVGEIATEATKITPSAETLNIAKAIEADQVMQQPTETKTPPSIVSDEVPPSAPLAAEQYVQQVRRIESDQVQQQSVEKPIQEVVVERRGSALPYVLLGAEYMARKRADRKLETRFTEKIARTDERANTAKYLQEELEVIVRQNREQLQALKEQRGATNEVMPRVEERSERVKQSVIAKELSQHTEQLRPAVENNQPEIAERRIFEQVAEAAEQNVPVEKVFERSHEVKDDTTTPVGATSVGAVMAATAQPSIQQMTQSSAQQSIGALPVISDGNHSVEYRQAMQAGFWSAVLIIILGSMAYLMLK